MTATFARPTIEGFEDVEAFVTEHGILDSLFVVYDITTRLFPMATQIRVERYVDPEDSHESLFFVISGVSRFEDSVVDLDMEWNRQVCKTIEPDHLWRIGHYHE